MKTGLAFMAMAVAAEAFVPPSSFAGSTISAPTTSSSRSSSSSLRMAGLDVLDETMAEIEKSVAPPGGGFWFGSAGFWGEEDYRGFVDTYKPNNLINGVYPIIDRVRDTKILTTTSEAGLLSTLADAGLTLTEAEKLLPALEEAGLLTFVANNLDVLINLFGFIAIEPAKLAIPALVSVVKTLKGAGLLNLSSDDAAPATAGASSPVKAGRAKASKAPKAAKVVAAPKASKAAPKASKAAPKASKAAPKAKPAAKKAKPAAKKAKPAAKKAAERQTVGNISNLPKAL